MSVLYRWGFLVIAGALFAACESAPEHRLEVEVVSGLVAGREIHRIETSVFREEVGWRDLVETRFFDTPEGMRLSDGVLVASTFVPRGKVVVVVRARTAEDRILLEQTTTLEVRVDRRIRVHLDRECLAVDCSGAAGIAGGTSCLAGECVDTRCNPSDREGQTHCGAALRCEVDTDCAERAPCSSVSCIDGVCVPVEREGADKLCDDEAWCNPDADGTGCVAIVESPAPRDPRCGTICFPTESRCTVGYFRCDGDIVSCEAFLYTARSIPCGEGRECDGLGACVDNRLPAVCGNGALEEGEACDDNNVEDGDGCSADCTRRTCFATNAAELRSAMGDTSCVRIEVARGEYDGSFVARHALELVGEDTNATVLRGLGGRVLTFSAASGEVSVTNMTVEDGDAGSGMGGAIRSSVRLRLDGVTFRGNRAVEGGAVRASRGAVIRGCVFEGNVARDRAGALSVADGTLEVTSSQFSGNRVEPVDRGSGFGGAVDLFRVTATFEDVVFADNSVVVTNGYAGGGAIYATDATVSLVRTRVAGNEISTTLNTDVDACPLGGAASFNESSLHATDSVFEANAVYFQGGRGACNGVGGAVAVFARTARATTVRVERSAFYRNEVHSIARRSIAEAHFISGAGLSLTSWGDALMLDVAVENSLFLDNELFADMTAIALGADIKLDSEAPASIRLRNSSFLRSAAATGTPANSLDAWSTSGEASIDLSHIVVAGSGCYWGNGVSVMSSGYNAVPLLCVGETYPMWRDVRAPTDLVDEGRTVETLGFGPFVPAPTPHYPRGVTSVLWTAGDPLGCTSVDGATPLVVDLVGNPRTGACDIGAVTATP